MKITCTKCFKKKESVQFRVRNAKKNKYSSWCKKCFNDYEREKWKSSRHRREQNCAKHTKRRMRNRSFVWNYLKLHPCKQCGETNPIVLVFDHIDRKTKLYNVSTMSRMAYSLAKIKNEMEKCRVLCANCHMKHTAKQMGWYKNISENSSTW